MNPADLEPIFGADSHPEAVRIIEDHRELMRRACVSALANRRREDIDPLALPGIEWFAALKPLGRALGTGEPT